MMAGFTGTRKGMSQKQKEALIRLIAESTFSEAHHGSCVGADYQFHDLCCTYGVPVVIHPPTNGINRAKCHGGRVLPAKPYIERNHDIVDACDVLIACPSETEEVLRSGTWATVRYARKRNKRVIVLAP